jgi:hypothetical protein
VPGPLWTGAGGMDNRPPGHGGALAGAGLSKAQKLTGGGQGQRGEGGEHVTRPTRAWEAAMQPSNSGEEAAAVALGGGDAQARRGEKESRERCGGGWQGLSLL